MANRGVGDNILVLNTTTGQVVGTIEGFGAAPDLMDMSPAGDLVYVTLRGPKALTGGPTAIGVTPGVAVLAVEREGVTGRRIAFLPIGDQGPESNVDPHAIAVRWVGGRPLGI
jgi:DNA-binding beta-propeller fold protein YncE